MGCLNSKSSPEEVVVMVPASRPGSRNRQSAEMGSKEILDAQKKWMGTEASSILEKNETMEDIGKKFRMVRNNHLMYSYLAACTVGGSSICVYIRV